MPSALQKATTDRPEARKRSSRSLHNCRVAGRERGERTACSDIEGPPRVRATPARYSPRQVRDPPGAYQETVVGRDEAPVPLLCLLLDVRAPRSHAGRNRQTKADPREHFIAASSQFRLLHCFASELERPLPWKVCAESKPAQCQPTPLPSFTIDLPCFHTTFPLFSCPFVLKLSFVQLTDE
jgi:hypothetical protein